MISSQSFYIQRNFHLGLNQAKWLLVKYSVVTLQGVSFVLVLRSFAISLVFATILLDRANADPSTWVETYRQQGNLYTGEGALLLVQLSISFLMSCFDIPYLFSYCRDPSRGLVCTCTQVVRNQPCLCYNSHINANLDIFVLLSLDFGCPKVPLHCYMQLG